MKIFILIILSALLFGCKSKINKPDTEKTNSIFDRIKTEEYGADKYGMKKYVMAYFKRGPNRDQDSTTAAELQKVHLKNITRMAEEGTLVLAGPF